MPIYDIDGRSPRIGKGSWVAPSAEIIGDVEIGDNCYIGFGAIIRGDFGKIKIGNESLVEECVVIHTAEMTEIGNKVIIGHMAMLHDAFIHDEALIGMKSMICEYATIGEKAIVAEQSLVRKIPKSLLERSWLVRRQRSLEMLINTTGKDWPTATTPILSSLTPIIIASSRYSL